MRDSKTFNEFGKPFPAEDVKWRYQKHFADKNGGWAIPYLDARAVADRLDEVVGQNRWKDSYTQWHSYDTNKTEKNAQLCTIYIYDEELKEWIGKTDGAEDSDIESIKGGLSDAFKRAAVKWNIGRYLYKFKPVWAASQKQGSSFVIADEAKEKLEQVYVSMIGTIFGKEVAAELFGGTGQKTKKDTPPKQNPATEQDSEQNTQPDTASQTAEIPMYEIKNVRVQQGANGENSTIVLAVNDKQYTTYLKGKDERLKVGVKLKNVQAEKKQNAYGTYHMLNSYDIAA